jgi:hypothetical protein
MKKKFYLLFLTSFMLTTMFNAQDILLESFDDPSAIGNWINSTAGSYTLSAASEHNEGSGAVSLEYNLVGDQGWGGSVDMRMESGSTFGDLTASEGLSFWYKVVTPSNDVASTTWTIKLLVNSTGGVEEWHASIGTIIGDTSGEWVKVEVPYTSFAIPSWMPTLDGVLYLDQIATIDMQIQTAEGVTATGHILVDALSAYGAGGSQDGVLLESFDDPSTIGNWINSTAGSYTLSAASEQNEGTGAVSLEYNLVGDQGWGGSVDMRIESGGTFGDLTSTDGISFWYKVITPSSDVASTTWTVKLLVNSTGGVEEWHASLGTVIGDTSGEWVLAKIPYTAFAIPSWMPTLDGVLYLDQIATIDMQIQTAEGVTATGHILVDALVAYAASGTQAGPLLESFDVTGDIDTWINSTAGSYSLSSSDDFVEGEAAACLDYILIADLDWGGSVDMGFAPDSAYFPDLNGETGVRFNYKVTQPASDASGVNWTVKLFIHSQGQVEQWHASLNNVLGDDSGEWQEAAIPFTSFAIPSWEPSYDGVLYLDSIHRIEMQVLAGSMGVESNGTICLDNLTSYSEASVEIFPGYTLNDMNTPTTGVGSWINSTDGSFNINPSADAAEGDSSVCVGYNLVADLSWGGSVDMQFLPQDSLFTDMTGHLGLSFWYKVNTPPDTPGNISFLVKLLINSTGGPEEWHRTVGGLLNDMSGEWVQIYIPFTAFAIPSWQTTYDGVLYLDQVREVQFQLLGVAGTTSTGDICFDYLHSYADEEVVTTGIVKEQVPKTVKVYPNPATLELTVADLENIQTIQVFNINGALVKTVNGQNIIDVADLYHGMYFLKIYADKAIYSAKFMKH